jgi:curved DNA-binding protein
MVKATTKDYYKLLGITKGASADDIKKAFRKAARKHHPDAGGSEETFKQVNEAYEVLSDEEKRAQYDQFGQVFGPNGPGPGYGSATGGGGAGNPFGGAYGAGNPFAGVDFGGGSGRSGAGGYQQVEFNVGDMGDIFGSMFGGGGSPFGRRTPSRGHDLQLDVTVSFEEALEGTSRKVQTGSANSPGSGGSGSSGSAGKDFTVTIPAGVADGGKLRFKGKGGVSPQSGGARGDLYVVTHIAPHAYFSRDKADVVLMLPLSVSEAALGTTVTVPLPQGGKANLKIPAGTQHGRVFRMKGKGAPKLKGRGKGDLKVKVSLVVPKRVNARQRKLLEELRESEGDLRGHLR